MSVAGNKSVAVCFAASLDGRRLPESKHLLVLYLTDLKNTGTEIEPEAGKPGSVIIRNPGHLPLLLRQGTVELTFRHETRTLPEIWALQYDGTRASKMEPTPTKSGFSFVAPAQMGPAVFAAYEIKWER